MAGFPEDCDVSVRGYFHSRGWANCVEHEKFPPVPAEAGTVVVEFTVREPSGQVRTVCHAFRSEFDRPDIAPEYIAWGERVFEDPDPRSPITVVSLRDAAGSNVATVEVQRRGEPSRVILYDGRVFLYCPNESSPQVYVYRQATCETLTAGGAGGE